MKQCGGLPWSCMNRSGCWTWELFEETLFAKPEKSNGVQGLSLQSQRERHEATAQQHAPTWSLQGRSMSYSTIKMS